MNKLRDWEVELHVTICISKIAYAELVDSAAISGISVDDKVGSIVEARLNPDAGLEASIAMNKRFQELGVTEEEFFDDIDEGIAEARAARLQREDSELEAVTREERKTGRGDARPIAFTPHHGTPEEREQWMLFAERRNPKPNAAISRSDIIVLVRGEEEIVTLWQLMNEEQRRLNGRYWMERWPSLTPAYVEAINLRRTELHRVLTSRKRGDNETSHRTPESDRQEP